MFYYLYQITNKINGKVYVGVHKTKNMDDGYMGSGKVIRDAIAKYGIQNFEKKILETFADSVSMYAREKEVVNEEFLARSDVYNLRRGGFGGFDHLNKTAQNNKNQQYLKGGRAYAERLLSDQEFRESETKRKSELFNQQYANGKVSIFKDPKLHEELTERARKANLGSTWINNGEAEKKIKREESIPKGWIRGRLSTVRSVG